MITTPFSRMSDKLKELEARADVAMEQREKLTLLVSDLKGRVETLERYHCK